MKNIFLSLICILAVSTSFAGDDLVKYKKGEGSKYLFEGFMGQAQVIMTVADQSESKLAIEINFKTTTKVPQEMWQQFILEMDSSKKLVLKEGYMHSTLSEKAEKINLKSLAATEDFEMKDFLITNKEELQKNKVAEEKVQTPAGLIQTTHYRVKSKGATLDYWISEQALPFGLVKMVSSGPEEKHKYSMTLEMRVKGVKPKINPKNVVSKEGRPQERVARK